MEAGDKFKTLFRPAGQSCIGFEVSSLPHREGRRNRSPGKRWFAAEHTVPAWLLGSGLLGLNRLYRKRTR
jgi:hypothetical protein